MKLIRIFGIVLALHVVGALVFIQPGCQSKPQARPQAGDTVPATGSLSDSREFELDTVGSDKPRTSPRRPSASAPASESRQTAQTDDLLQPLDSTRIPSESGSVSAPATESAGTYTVKRGDSLWQIAERHGVSMQSLLSINGLSENSIIQPGQKLKLPAGSAVQASAPIISRAPQAEGTTTYKVQSGDSLSVIAQRHNISVAELKRLNSLSSDVIRIDQILYVPEGGGSRPAARSSSTSSSAPSSVSASGATHTVSSGETPGGIAQKYGVTVDQLMSANNISDPRRMQIGQKLVIPGKAETSGSSSAGSTRTSERTTEAEPVQKEEPAPAPEVSTDDDLFLIPFEDEDDTIPIIEILPQQ